MYCVSQFVFCATRKAKLLYEPTIFIHGQFMMGHQVVRSKISLKAAKYKKGASHMVVTTHHMKLKQQWND